MTSSGLLAANWANEQPHRSMTPGPIFSMRMSADCASDWTVSAPPGWSTSMQTLRMLLVRHENIAVVCTPDGSNILG